MKSYLVAFFFLASVQVFAQLPALEQYNICWDSQSKNSGESMPCGGGDVGLNVWVENGDVFCYLSRSGAFDENNQFLKLGRVRLTFAPNPFENSDSFLQELKLKDGYVALTGKKDGLNVEIAVWVDVFRPIVHLEVKSSQAIKATASYESWRTEDRAMVLQERTATSYKTMPDMEVTTFKDTIAFEGDKVLFYHRNRRKGTAFDFTVSQQGMDAVKDKLQDPLQHLTFGGYMLGKAMIAAGTTTGRYAGTSYTGWKLTSTQPSRTHDITLYLHIGQATTKQTWHQELDEIVGEDEPDQEKAWKESRAWWYQYWERSHIFINPDDNSKQKSPEWQAGRNYQLFRYMLGCNAYGTYPTKFNGGLFTYDPMFVNKADSFNADYRRWGGGTFTAQNQRLVYWPMLKSGDFDMMKSQFNFYLKALKNAEQRSKFYWDLEGACFTEQLENFGLPQAFEYNANEYIFGQQRPDSFEKGLQYNTWLSQEWDTVLEFCLMMLDVEQYTGEDIAAYIPLIESSLTFFDQYYQQEQLKRSTQPLDANGHLVLYPGSAAETYKTTYNSVTTVAGLTSVLTRLLTLPEKYLSEEKRRHWKDMLARIPPLSFRQMQGHKAIAPAVVWERINNEEIPQLYPVFPYGMYGIGKPDLEIAVNTWKYDTTAQKFKSHVGWKQDNIFCARMGLTEEASAITVKKLQDSERRFPAFWGPGFDWVPDHNWGGSGMIGLQEMLMQTNGTNIYLFPAWPAFWDVNFKLYAPQNTTVEGELKNGKLVSFKVVPESRKKDVEVLLKRK